jgi:hypothetical protein
MVPLIVQPQRRGRLLAENPRRESAARPDNMTTERFTASFPATRQRDEGT